MSQDLHFVITDLLGNDHHTDFTSGLDSIAFSNTRKVIGNTLQFIQTADIILKGLAAGTGTGSRNGIGSLDQDGAVV